MDGDLDFMEYIYNFLYMINNEKLRKICIIFNRLGSANHGYCLNKNIIFLSSDTNIFRKGTCKQNPKTDHQTSNHQEMNYISLINDFFDFFSVLFRLIICLKHIESNVE